MILFGQCGCPADPLAPFSTVQAIAPRYEDPDGQTLVVPVTVPRGKVFFISSRIGFKANSTRDFFWHPTLTHVASIQSFTPTENVFIENNWIPSGRISVPGKTAALSLDAFDSQPSSWLTFYTTNAVLPSDYVTDEGDPFFRSLSTDSSREFVRIVNESNLASSVDSFVFRRSDLILGEFQGEEYLMTPEQKHRVSWRLCASTVSAFVEFTVGSGMFQEESQPGFPFVLSHHDSMVDNIETEAFALFSYYGN